MLSADRKTGHLVPTWQYLEVLESIDKTLFPLTDYTDIFSGLKFVTFSALIPILKYMADNELHEDSEDTALTADIKRKVSTVRKNC